MSYPKNNLTYRNIISDFEQAASESIAVATFDTGTIDFLDANAVNKNYPYLYLRPISSQGVVDKVKSLSFELYSMDVPTLADQSPVRVLSETEQRIYDTMAWFNFGPASRQQVYEITMTDLSPVNEAFQDRVFGWVATIEVATPFNWNYCDYPKVWPTPTATVRPTSTPTPSPTLFPPTPTATGPTPTPTTSPTPTPSSTATPTPTISPTPTATPLPTVPPTPTPSPTAAPVYFEFKIDNNNQSGSLSGSCDLSQSLNFESVYVDWNDSDPIWPDRIVGKSVYSNEGLTNIYTGSAISDGSAYRLAYGSESVSATPSYAAIDIEWMQFTASNIVNTLVPCAFPVIETRTSIPQTVSSSLISAQVDNFAGRNFDQYGFQYSTGSTADNMLEGTAYTASQIGLNPWEYNLEIDINSSLYVRGFVRDDQSGAYYYGDIEIAEPKPAYAYPFRYEDAIPAGALPDPDLSSLIADRDDAMSTQCGLVIPSADTIYVASEFSTGSNPTPPYGCTYPDGPYTINDFIGQSVWIDKAFTTPLPLLDPDDYEAHFCSVHGQNTQNDFMIMKEDVHPVTSQHIKTNIVSGSLSCTAPNDCNP